MVVDWFGVKHLRTTLRAVEDAVPELAFEDEVAAIRGNGFDEPEVTAVVEVRVDGGVEVVEGLHAVDRGHVSGLGERRAERPGQQRGRLEAERDAGVLNLFVSECLKLRRVRTLRNSHVYDCSWQNRKSWAFQAVRRLETFNPFLIALGSALWEHIHIYRFLGRCH